MGRRAPHRYAPSRTRELPLDPDLPARVCLARPPARAGGHRLDDWWPSLGAGRTVRQAARAARAEMVERTCALFHGNEPLVQASFRDLAGAAVHPDQLLLFSRRQRRTGSPRPRSPLTRVPPAFDETAVLDWVAARSLQRDTVRYLPAMYVYFRHPAPRGRRWCPGDSSGVAAGRTRAEATARALLELVERDSVALWWYNRVRRPALDGRALADREVDQLMDGYAAMGRAVWMLDLTSDLGIPVVAAVSRRRAGPRDDLALGFGAAFSPVAAARHALYEMAQMLAVRRAGWRGGQGTAAFERWRRTARTDRYPFLRPVGTALHPSRVARDLSAAATVERCRRALAARGLEPLVCDLSRPGAPWRVIRAVVPGLRHVWPRFAPGRLYDAPVAAGWRQAPRTERRLNAVPLLV